MTQRNLTVILASLVLLVALASIGRRIWQTPPVIDSARFIGMGQVLADETTKAVSDRGRVVVVINEQHQLRDTPAHTEWQTFQAELKKHPSVSLAATEVVPPDLSDFNPGAGCSPAQLRDILAKHATVDAIVFFFGLPEWEKVAVSPPGQPTAKVLVSAGQGVPTKMVYSGYFASRILSVLIGARALPASPPTPPTPREAFQQYYQIFTFQNSESLPD